MQVNRARAQALAPACALVASAALAAAPPVLPCRENDRECAARERLANPAKKLDFWKSWLEKPVRERHGAAPIELLQFLGLDNLASGYRERPRAVTVPPDLRADFEAALRSIPDRVWRAADKRLVGIFFLEELSGTALCDYVAGGWFERERGFIVLDMAVLAKYKANEWATWKENTPFKPSPRYALEAQIEDEAGNTRANAIRYIVLHELGHILSIGSELHPRWDQPPPPPDDIGKFPFANHSWRIKADRSGYQSVFDEAMPRRRDITYYFGAKLEAADMVPMYQQLEGTSFPTLYAATHPGDDFAESFASYVHTQIDRRPWEILLREGGEVRHRFTPCWNAPRCAEKRGMIEALLRP
jgi:hypothetical protein